MLISDDYEIKELIYEGIKNSVFRAVRTSDKKPVIIKTPSNDNYSQYEIASYRKEFQLLSYLHNVDGVIHAYELVESELTIFMVLEDNDSQSLIHYIREQRFDLIEAIEIAIQLASIIEKLHQKSVIHKDINPYNILWNEKLKKICIIDFGIATVLSNEQSEFKSISQLEGTIAYISPEQTGRVNRQIDHRSDLYSLGISLYELFTKQLPYIHEQTIEYVHAHIAHQAIPAHKLNNDVPQMISMIIAKLMRKIADHRYQTSIGLKLDLKLCLKAMAQSTPLHDFKPGLSDVSPFLQIPQKLYGRTGETESLLDSFERICQGQSELVLITGFAGAGKTVLVKELYKPITEKKGSYIAGKFDQYQRDVPYFAWKKVLESFLQLLLKEDQQIIAQWQTKIKSALGEIAAIIVDLVPGFEAIIGKPKAVPKLSGEQALNRFHYAFGKLINAITAAEHPLTIFIDDWQWADASSINLLKYLTNQIDSSYLLIITSWRDNEVDNTHLFSLALNEIKKTNISINEIYVENLDIKHVKELIDDTLLSPDSSDELVQLVYEKTQGNAFFLRQFLKMLYSESLLYINKEQSCWQWDIRKIHAKQITNNVVELMSAAILTMDNATQKALRLAACIGNKFENHTLAIILQQTQEKTKTILEPAIAQGILISTEQHDIDNINLIRYYQFIHDRVQQAAYNLIDEDQRFQTHYKIAKIFLNTLDTDEHIFEITQHINLAKELFIDSGETPIIIDCNDLAGKKAKQGHAYLTAYHYYIKAIEHISPKSWQTNLSQTSDLFLSATETAYLVTEYSNMEKWAEQVLQFNHDILTQVDIYEIRLRAYIAQNRLNDAVDIALYALNKLDVKLPKNPNKIKILWNLFLTKKSLWGKSFNNLLNLNELNEPRKLKAMNLLGLSIPPAYWTSQDLLALIVLHMVRGTVNYGYYPNSGYAFSWWGILLSALLNKTKQGCEFGAFGETMAKEHHLYLEQPVFFKGWITHHLQNPLSECVEILSQAYYLAMEQGNFEYASYALNNNMQARFYTSETLPELLDKMHTAHQDLEKFQVKSSLYWHDIWWQTAINLNNINTPCSYELNGIAYDETVKINHHESEKDASTLFLVFTAKLMLSIIFNQQEQAESFAQKARQYLKGGAGMFAFILFYFYESLTLLRQADKSVFFKKHKILLKVKKNLKKLAEWAKFAPDNHIHRYHLVKAEYFRVSGAEKKAENHYELAIDKAEDNHFIQDAALCYEYAAAHYQKKKQVRFVKPLIKRSLHLYQVWGAEHKVMHLLEQYPFDKGYMKKPACMFTPSSTEFSSSTNRSYELDMQSLFKSCQTISNIIILEDLIKNLLVNVLENAGAQKAVFILRREKGFFIEGQIFLSENDQKEISVLQSVYLNNAVELLPFSIINYVRNSLNPLVLDNAEDSKRFSQDAYIKKYKPVSVLCVPILKQGILNGFVYLENNLTIGAFDKERIEFLKLLMSQVAISIENATVYEQLEDKVAERTKELDKAYTKLSEANIKLETQAQTDALTQLANRHYFNELAHYQFNNCIRNKKVITVLMIDLDNFKAYNDTYGHLKGDECLKLTASEFKKVFNRKTDIIARYGGEEFVILLPETDQNKGHELAEKLRANIQSQSFEHIGNCDYKVVTLSIGLLSMIPDNNNSIDECLNKAVHPYH